MPEPKRYIEKPERIYGGILSDEEYGRAMQSFVVVCTDFVPVDIERRLVFLAKRVVHSSMGIWRFGGRQRAGETTRESCTRLAKRELDLILTPDRFEYLTLTEDLWAWRKQAPQESGGHNLIHQFSIELTQDELAHATSHLDPNEYDKEFGIQAFDRARLVKECVRPQLLDMYDALFVQM